MLTFRVLAVRRSGGMTYLINSFDYPILLSSKVMLCLQSHVLINNTDQCAEVVFFRSCGILCYFLLI